MPLCIYRGDYMEIALIVAEIVLVFCIYQTRKAYKSGVTMLLSNDSEFLEQLPEDLKGTFIQESRTVTLKMYGMLMLVPPFIYMLYKCNFNTIWIIIFPLLLVGGILFYNLNKITQMQHEYTSKLS